MSGQSRRRRRSTSRGPRRSPRDFWLAPDAGHVAARQRAGARGRDSGRGRPADALPHFDGATIRSDARRLRAAVPGPRATGAGANRRGQADRAAAERDVAHGLSGRGRPVAGGRCRDWRRRIRRRPSQRCSNWPCYPASLAVRPCNCGLDARRSRSARRELAARAFATIYFDFPLAPEAAEAARRSWRRPRPRPCASRARHIRARLARARAAVRRQAVRRCARRVRKR